MGVAQDVLSMSGWRAGRRSYANFVPASSALGTDRAYVEHRARKLWYDRAMQVQIVIRWLPASVIPPLAAA